MKVKELALTMPSFIKERRSSAYEVGVTVVVATHDLHLVRESGLRSIVIEGGPIARSDPGEIHPVIRAER